PSPPCYQRCSRSSLLLRPPGAKTPSIAESPAGRHGPLRALGAGIDPCLDQLSKKLLASRSRRAALAWIPRPGDHVVARHVLVQQLEIAAAVARGVLDLPADVADRLALPRHLGRCEAPAPISRNALV